MAATDPAPEMVDRPAFVDDDFVFVARRVEADAESARWERNRKQALVRLRAGRRVAPRLLSYYHIDPTSVRTETALRRRSWAYDRQAHLRRRALGGSRQRRGVLGNLTSPCTGLASRAHTRTYST